MTQRLYYADSYTCAFTARVVETLTVDGNPAVVLNRTYFYPTGGGQPHDTGLIANAHVTDVRTRADDKALLHLLDAPLMEGEALAAGDVLCGIDWGRRFDFMQQHTGQHILTQAFVQTCGANTVGFHLGAETVTIDLDAAALTSEQIAQAESVANHVLYENRAVTTRMVDPDAADGVRMRRVPEALATDGLRVVEVKDFDTTACGGTHVARTGEIGMIKVLRSEKYKGGTRIEFVCGERALAAMQARVELINRLTSDLTCAMTDLPAIVGGLREQIGAAEKTIKALREGLIEGEALELLMASERHGDARVVVAVYEDRDAAELRLLAARLVAAQHVIALLGIAGEKSYVICARSTDLPDDMNVLLKRALEPLGGRGGGSPSLAQGGGGTAGVDMVRAALAGAVSPPKV
ncbi:MAG: DHHA1 domain-containing protein [Chloroflexota bacterium]|nr:DHHA1 domain-containing protein [Chloroflexota bacterium]